MIIGSTCVFVSSRRRAKSTDKIQAQINTLAKKTWRSSTLIPDAPAGPVLFKTIPQRIGVQPPTQAMAAPWIEM